MSKWLLAPPIALIAGLTYWLLFPTSPPMPKFDLDEWWGPEDLANKKQDTSIRPFKIQFAEEMIKDLRYRLKNRRRSTPPLKGVGFEYGFNTDQLDGWVEYWSEKYDFKAREAMLNKYPHYKTNVQGLNIHFMRIKPQSTKKQVIPLLLLHGWPGSIREFYEVIPHLTAESKDRDFELDLIIPSLPGYGFSDPAVRPGLGSPQMAIVLRNLMHRLGFKKFYVQGGDWGAIVGTVMSTLFQDEVLGFHSNGAIAMTPQGNFLSLLGSIFPSIVVDDQYKNWMYPLGSKWANLLEETGYMHIQATKPDTVGVSLNDSPSGLLAYILEKFSTWTNKDFKSLPDGGLLKKFSKDQLIDNIMMYWVPNAITSSVRLYAETCNFRTFGYNLDSIPTKVPTWVVQAKNDLLYTPPSLIKRKFLNLVNATHFTDGGHFLAFELPVEFSKDLLNAIVKFRQIKTSGKTEL